MSTVRISGSKKHSSVNGPGDVIQEILQTKYLDGLTFSGGDPLLQPDAVIEIARAAKNAGLNIWLYTGWTFEQIQKGAAGEKAKEALTQLDVLVDGPFVEKLKTGNAIWRGSDLVDGPFVEKLKTGNAIWRGSDNQRLIDVPRSLAEGSVIELPESKIE